MKMLCASAFIALGALFSATAKDRHCMLRLHVEANPHDSATLSASVRARFSGQEVAIEKVARITEGDVVAFYPYQIAKDNYGALFQLDDHGTIALDTLSIERRSSLLFVFINRRPITELQIDKRVYDGQIYIASGLTESDIDSMKKDWPLIRQKTRSSGY